MVVLVKSGKSSCWAKEIFGFEIKKCAWLPICGFIFSNRYWFFKNYKLYLDRNRWRRWWTRWVRWEGASRRRRRWDGLGRPPLLPDLESDKLNIKIKMWSPANMQSLLSLSVASSNNASRMFRCSSWAISEGLKLDVRTNARRWGHLGSVVCRASDRWRFLIALLVSGIFFVIELSSQLLEYEFFLKQLIKRCTNDTKIYHDNELLVR